MKSLLMVTVNWEIWKGIAGLWLEDVLVLDATIFYLDLTMAI